MAQQERTIGDVFDELFGEDEGDMTREMRGYEEGVEVEKNWNEGLRGGRLYVRCIVRACGRMAVVMHRERLHGEEGSGRGYKWSYVMVQCGQCRRMRVELKGLGPLREEHIMEGFVASEAAREEMAIKGVRDKAHFVEAVEGKSAKQQELFRRWGTELAMRSVRLVGEGYERRLEVLDYVDMDFL